MKEDKNKVRLRRMEAHFKNKNLILFLWQKGFALEAKNVKPFFQSLGFGKLNKKYKPFFRKLQTYLLAKNQKANFQKFKTSTSIKKYFAFIQFSQTFHASKKVLKLCFQKVGLKRLNGYFRWAKTEIIRFCSKNDGILIRSVILYKKIISLTY